MTAIITIDGDVAIRQSIPGDRLGGADLVDDVYLVASKIATTVEDGAQRGNRLIGVTCIVTIGAVDTIEIKLATLATTINFYDDRQWLRSMSDAFGILIVVERDVKGQGSDQLLLRGFQKSVVVQAEVDGEFRTTTSMAQGSGCWRSTDKIMGILMHILAITIPTIGVVVVVAGCVGDGIVVIGIAPTPCNEVTTIGWCEGHAVDGEVGLNARLGDGETRQHHLGIIGVGGTSLALHDGIHLGGELLFDAGGGIHGQRDSDAVNHVTRGITLYEDDGHRVPSHVSA